MNEHLEDTAERSETPAPQHEAAGGLVGWVTAHRMLTGQPVGPGADALRALLASASAPATAEELSQAALNVLLDAYRQEAVSPVAVTASLTIIGPAAEPDANSAQAPAGARVPRRIGRAMAVKCTSVLLVAVGTGAAAAGTDTLPASIQRVAHHYFGGLGIPAPSVQPDSAGAAASASATAPPAGSASPPAGAAPISELITLCGEIQHGAKNWRNGIDAAQQAELSAAAGGDLKVTSFCAQLLAQSGSGTGSTPGQSATPSPSTPASGAASASPGDDAGSGKGKGKDTHSPSPNPHSTTSNH